MHQNILLCLLRSLNINVYSKKQLMELNPSQILFIGSGKGGVGKSTVAVNLAVALAQQGLKVGLLDADVYGPSIPIMLGLRRLSPRIERLPSGTEKIIPLTKFGIQVISLGFFIEEAHSIIWRGPMLHGTLQKMLQGVAWGELDLLVIDLPPETGDILLSLTQLLKGKAGALVVCTPQEVAMLDAIKAINAFDQLDIPLWGIIENMAGFQVPETEQIFHIFGQGKAQELALRFQTQLLVSIPLMTNIRRGGDEGIPSALHPADLAGRLFQELASVVIQHHLQPLSNPFQI
jgi:ATP-binding protein involved in chromosome partitioning